MKELEEAEVKKKCALFLKDVWDKKKNKQWYYYKDFLCCFLFSQTVDIE